MYIKRYRWENTAKENSNMNIGFLREIISINCIYFSEEIFSRLWRQNIIFIAAKNYIFHKAISIFITIKK